MRVPLLGAIVLLLGAAVAVALVPAGIDLDRRVAGELRRVAIADLGRAPMILGDRNAARAEALSMHAMTVAATEGLVRAVQEGELGEAEALARSAAALYGEDPVVISAGGDAWVGPPLTDSALYAVRRGGSWTGYLSEGGVPRAVGLMALEDSGRWAGAAGASSPFDDAFASTLAGLVRSDVTILAAAGGLVATTLDSVPAERLAAVVLSGGGRAEGEGVRAVSIGEDAADEFWVASAMLPGAGSVVFSRSVADELAALPGVRRGYAVAGLLTLLLAIGVGAVVATVLLRPVRGLAVAAAQVSQGDFAAPVPDSRVEEIDQLGASFRTMRDALRRRLAELSAANDELEEKQRRLSSLQAELIRQDRLTSSARMVAELAHEIRNPVANVRNCLEVVRRGVPEGSEESRFADMAIDELLRMHELAEHLLDLNRPADAAAGSCSVVEVAGSVADLAAVGAEAVEVSVRSLPNVPDAAVAPDALKQILFNLIQNAAEAGGIGTRVELWIKAGGDQVRIEVADDGPGIDEMALPRIFDPFFTTKDAVTGVGLGLFVADGLARRYGGALDAANREGAPGARFTLVLPAVRGDSGRAEGRHGQDSSTVVESAARPEVSDEEAP